MPRKIFVRPLDDRKIDDPTSLRRVPPEGMEVQDSPFWRARVRAGEAEILKSAPVAAKASPTAAPPPKTKAVDAPESKDEPASAKKGNK